MQQEAPIIGSPTPNCHKFEKKIKFSSLLMMHCIHFDKGGRHQICSLAMSMKHMYTFACVFHKLIIVFQRKIFHTRQSRLRLSQILEPYYMKNLFCSNSYIPSFRHSFTYLNARTR